MAKATCVFEGCSRQCLARGLCGKHWEQAKREGRLSTFPLVRDGKRAQGDYVAVYEPEHPLAAKGGYVLEHRKVVYDAGIDVPKGYIVHHLNEDPSDNRLENLQVISRGEHSRLHHQQRGYVTTKDGVFPIAQSEDERRERIRESDRRRKQRRRTIGPTS